MSGLLGGGSSSSSSSSTNVSVTVNPQISNTIVNDDARLQSLVDKLAEGNADQRAIIMATAEAQVEVAKAQAAQAAANTEKVTDTIKNAVMTAVIGFAVTQMLRRG